MKKRILALVLSVCVLLASGCFWTLAEEPVSPATPVVTSDEEGFKDDDGNIDGNNGDGNIDDDNIDENNDDGNDDENNDDGNIDDGNIDDDNIDENNGDGNVDDDNIDENNGDGNVDAANIDENNGDGNVNAANIDENNDGDGNDGNACPHSETHVESGSLEEVKYVTLNAKKHELRAKVYDYIICDNCNNVIDKELTNENFVDSDQNHEYEDGSNMCKQCEFVNNCTHENTTTEEKFDIEGVEHRYQEIEGDDTHHTTFIPVYINAVICDNCGHMLSSDGTGERSEPFGHSYDTNEDGEKVCNDCGHVLLCTHENAYYDEFVDNPQYTQLEGEDAARYHLVAGQLWGYDVCEDCWNSFNEELVDEDYSGTEEHCFEDGVCSDCDYVNTCTHEDEVDVWEGLDGEEAELVSTTATHHTLKGTLFQRIFCYECGEMMETVLQENYTDAEPHCFEDGFCGVCGYENECQHPYVNCYVRPLDWDIIERDERTHTWGGVMVKVSTCSSCDEIVGEEEIEGVDSIRELHEYENGECMMCGYVNECTHPQMAGMKRIGGVIEVISSDASGHTVVYEAFELKMCPFCQYMIDTPIAPETRTEKHSFWFNECECCGYMDTELSCTHENLSEEIDIGHEVSDQATADYHLSSGIEYNETYCLDCGRMLKSEFVEVVEDMQRPHRYFLDNVCFDCGYVKPVATPKPAAKPTAAPTMPVVSDEPVEKPALEDMKEQKQLHGLRPENETPMSEAIIIIAEAVDKNGEQQSVHVANVDKIVTVEEKQVLDALPVQEKIMTVLAILGFEDQVNKSLEASGEVLSDAAIALKEQVLGRVAAMDEAEKAEFNAALAESFPTETLVVDGVEYTWFVLEIEVRTGNAIHYERYGFRLEGDEWILTKLYQANN